MIVRRAWPLTWPFAVKQMSQVVIKTLIVRRAFPGLASGLALAVRPTGSAEAPRARVGPEDAFCGAVFAERVERIFGCPCGWRGRPGQCAAFRPGVWDFSPGDRCTWRKTTGPASSQSAGPTARYGGVRPRHGAGHRRGGQRPATVRYRARGSGPGCPATCGESPPHPWPLRRGTPPLVHALRARPTHPSRDRPGGPVGLARRRCALETVEKVVTGPER